MTSRKKKLCCNLIQTNMYSCFKNQCDDEVGMTCIPSPCHIPVSGYLLRTPDNSNFILISLEGSSYRWLTVFPDLLADCF